MFKIMSTQSQYSVCIGDRWSVVIAISIVLLSFAGRGLAVVDSGIGTSNSGKYVMSTKGQDTTGEIFTKLSMYTFNSDGTITDNYWRWDLSKSPAVNGAPLDSTRTIGTVIGASPANTDANGHIRVQGKFLAPVGNPLSTVSSRSGTYVKNGRTIGINWNTGVYEAWYATWEEAGNLYKLEQYNGSDRQAVTEFYLDGITTGADGRNKNAMNYGVGFGSSGADFTLGASVADMKKHLWKGTRATYNNELPDPDLPVNTDVPAFYADFKMTDTDVLRHKGVSGTTSGTDVYYYLSKPQNNAGILNRRAYYHFAHDNNHNGRIDDAGNWPGHQESMLQIIDGSGNYRGLVGSQFADTDGWASGWYRLDAKEFASHLGVSSDMKINRFTEGFETLIANTFPTTPHNAASPFELWSAPDTVPGQYTSVSTEQAKTGTHSMKLFGPSGGSQGSVYAQTVQYIDKGSYKWSQYLLRRDPSSAAATQFLLRDGFGNEIPLNLWISEGGIRDGYTNVFLDTSPTVLTTGGWQDFEVVFDKTDLSQGIYGTYSLFIDGIQVGTDQPLQDGDITTFWFAGTSTANVYYDDVSLGVINGVYVIPEPATLTIICLCVTMLTVRRRHG